MTRILPIAYNTYREAVRDRILYNWIVFAHPVQRWAFLFGKFIGLFGTLTFNAVLMSVGFFAALFYLSHSFGRPDIYILAAIYFIVLQLMMMTALAMFFSTFSSPLLSS